MELDQRIIYFSAICLSVLVLCPLVEGGCQEEIMQRPDAMECLTSFGTFFSNSLGSGTGTGNEGEAIFKAICSPEGKAALQCLFDFMQECPDLFSGTGQSNPISALGQIEGFDMGTFMKEGALDATCALLVGPCSKVQECFSMPTNMGRMKRQEQPSSMNNYLLFMSLKTRICGPYKQQMDCMLKALEHCPQFVVSQVEAQFEAAINISTSSQADDIVSYKDTKSFIQNECAKLPSDETCLNKALLSQNFSDCNEDVHMTYSKSRTCKVHEMGMKCIQSNVGTECSKDDTAFLYRNLHMIYPGIPSDCSDDVSASNLVQTSLGLLLISALLSLIL